MNSQFDLFKSRDARDKGITQVLHNNEPWSVRAIQLMARLTGEMSGEEIRMTLMAWGLERPAHPNAWGGLMSQAIKAGIITDTGRLTQMKDEKSHARRTPVWQFRRN